MISSIIVEDFINSVDVNSSIVDNAHAISCNFGFDMNAINDFYRNKKVSITAALADHPEPCAELLDELNKQMVEVKDTVASPIVADSPRVEESSANVPQNSSDVVESDEPRNFSNE